MASNTLLKFEIPASKTDWIPITLEVFEGLSQLFEIKVTAYSTLMPSTAGQLLQKSGTITLNAVAGAPRYFNGLITDITPYEVLNRSGIYRYEMVLRPWLYLLDLTQNNKIFNNMSVLEIVFSVMQNCPEMSAVRGPFSGQSENRPYTVQYQESDFHFISRLLEEEGLSYYFTHKDNDHAFCILDGAQGLLRYSQGPIPFGNGHSFSNSIHTWSHRYIDEPTEFEVQGYNFETPTFQVIGNAGQPSKNPLIGKYCEYSDDIQTTAQANARAQLLAERATARADTIKAASHCSLLAPGMTFALTDHPLTEENGNYLVTEITHRAVDAYYWEKLKEHINPNLSITQDVYENTFSGIPGKNTFRPEALHQKLKIDGYHLAKVCGPEGESMWVDEYGRVRVTFSWDLDQTMACYMRVAQPWAGNGMGVQFFPRVGDEVIVKYMSGDIDYPIIVGSASNGDNKPIYPLPQQTSSSGFRTQSLQTTDTTQRNGLQFVDAKGAEAINIYAQQDFNIDVNNNFQIQIGNDQTINVGGDFTSTTVVGDITYGAKSITLQVGSSQIIINEQGVFFNAPSVTIKTSNGMTEVQGAARVGDQTQCPQQGHGEGTIHTGSPNVFINGAAVARKGDPVYCEDGSTDTITQGISGLYVNGQQAAALNHYTEHNGVIQTSSAGVMLGGGSSPGVPPSNAQCVLPNIEHEVEGFEPSIPPYPIRVLGAPYIAYISAILKINLNLTQKNCLNPLTFNEDGFSIEARNETQGLLMDLNVKDKDSILESPPTLTLYNNYGDYTVELTLIPPDQDSDEIQVPGELHFIGKMTKNNPFPKNSDWIITGQIKMEVDVRLIPDNFVNGSLPLPQPAKKPAENAITEGDVYYTSPALAQGSALAGEGVAVEIPEIILAALAFL